MKMDHPVIAILICIFTLLLVAPKNLVSTTNFDLELAKESDCEFPESWRGQWLHLGFPQPLNISKNFISSKGTCLHRRDAKFIVAERYNCVKCMVIHEKHPNVLQYKESFCDPLSKISQGSEINVDDLCQTIESDSALFFMFRHPPQPASCPFEGVHAFSYSTRGGSDICMSDPPSRIDSCTNPSKMMLKFQACPDVQGSEANDEILECIAGWKEGSSRYLVGRLQPISSSPRTTLGTSTMPSYQCFRYEHQIDSVDDAKRKIVTKMSQSYRGSCEGLWSAEEGDKTYTLWQVETELRECGLPNWLVAKAQWNSLDTKLQLEMKGGTRRFTLTMSRRKRKSKRKFEDDHETEGESEKISSHMTCHNIILQNETFVKLVVYQKLECTSGYRCFELTQMHPNVIHMRMGNRSRHADEACSQHFFSSSSQPVKYLIPEGTSEDCPFLGRFEETEEYPKENPDGNKGSVWSFRHKDKPTAAAESSGAVTNNGPTCHNWLQSGCPLNNNMVIHQCSSSFNGSKQENSRQDQIRDVTCLGHWPKPTVALSNIRVLPLEATTMTPDTTSSKNGTEMIKSSLLPILSNAPTYLIVQERNGLARCVEYSRVSVDDRPKLFVKVFEFECFEQTWLAQANLTYQGACQEALTDVSSISIGIESKSMQSGFVLFVCATLWLKVL